jgi:multisubunit Na+/H+ antiporter MnhG subunit
VTRELGRALMVIGGVLLLVGIALTAFGGLGLMRLPGDFVYRRGNFTFFFPLATSILLSIVLSLLLWLFRR